MTVRGAQDRIVKQVSDWEGVSAGPHRFGGTEFRFGRRELGHVHADSLADIVFPKDVRDRLVEEGRAEPHQYVPNSGWVTFRFDREEDVEVAIELFRMSYQIAKERLGSARVPLPSQ